MSKRKFTWSEHIPHAVDVLSRCVTASEAAEILAFDLQHPVTQKSLLNALSRARAFGELQLSAKEIVGSKRLLSPIVQAPRLSKSRLVEKAPLRSTDNDEHLVVVQAVQRGAHTREQLADAMDCSPRSAQQAVDAAVAAGHTISLDAAGGFVFELPPVEVQEVHGVPRDGKWTMIAVMSDLHVGSKHCMEEDATRFVEFAYEEGFRHILIPGDVCEGNLRHHGLQYELRCPGFDEQVDRLFQVLPQKPGLEYRFCVGNHEINSWWKSIGIRPDHAIQMRAHAAGRQDLIASGAMTNVMESAYLSLNPGDPETEIKTELSHTSDKKAYALSYPLQKHVESIQPGAKPHLLLKGHLHAHSFFDLRGVVCIQAACFKAQGEWERSKRMLPQIGGILLWVKHEGQYFDVKHHWKAVRPAPQIWEPINKQ